MTFERQKKKEAANGERQKEVHRAVLLIKRSRESPSADVNKRLALWKLEQAIPDDVKREAYEIVGSNHSASERAEGVAAGNSATLLQEITSQPNVIEAMAADLKAAGLEVSEAEVRQYLAGVDFDALAKQVGEGAV